MSGIGFTASRNLPSEVLPELKRRLDSLSADMYVTGGCIGGDHQIGSHLRETQEVRHVVIVPANRSMIAAWWRRFPDGTVDVREMPPGTSYADRNAEIVKLSDQLIAVPAAPEDSPMSWRSGTWQTVRMARRKRLPIEVWSIPEMRLLGLDQ